MTQVSESEREPPEEASRWYPYTSLQMKHAVRLVIAGLFTMLALVYIAATGQVDKADWYLIALLVVVGIGGGTYGGVRLVRWAKFRKKQ